MRGVSAAKEDVHNAIKNIDKGIFPQAFCKIIPDILGGDPEYCNIMHADGAGTKSSLAYMYWKETGDLSVWKGIAQDAIVMNTDDLLCVGAVDNILVSSTIGRNKMLIPGEVISAIINGTDDLLHEMREMGIGIYPTGGETADVGDLVRTIIVDSTVTCRMKRSDVINNANIRPGDVIVGLSSTGQATYEKKYNGGMGSNGLTSARHDVFAKYLAENYPESYDHAVPDELVYSGKYKLTDEVEGSPVNAGELVLSPTRTYAPVIKKILDELRPEIHGMVHCTGGAQTKVLHFVGENCKVVKSSTQIGHAVWRRKYCVPLTDNVDCGNCARHCPVGAIQMVPSDPNDDTSIEIPVVNTEKCIGCGSCEYVCPARPHAAIYVEGHEVHKTV